jgi:hypothetical protein
MDQLTKKGTIGTPIGARSADVEITRWYNDIDINRLLIEMSNHQEDYLVFDSITLDEAQITQRLTDASYQINEVRNIVIPVNLGQSEDGIYRGNHWTSLVIRNQEDGLHIYYQDSVGNPIPELLVTQIRNVFQDSKIHDLQVRQQENVYDCGPWTIFNLCALAMTGELPENIDENAIIDQREYLRDLPLESPEHLHADDEEQLALEEYDEEQLASDEYDEETDRESDEEELEKALEEKLIKIVDYNINALKESLDEHESQLLDDILSQYTSLFVLRNDKVVASNNSKLSEMMHLGKSHNSFIEDLKVGVMILKEDVEKDDDAKSVISNADDVHKKLSLLETVLGESYTTEVKVASEELTLYRKQKKEKKAALKELTPKIAAITISAITMADKSVKDDLSKQKTLMQDIRKAEVVISRTEKIISRALFKHIKQKDSNQEDGIIKDESTKPMIDMINIISSSKADIKRLEEEILNLEQSCPDYEIKNSRLQVLKTNLKDPIASLTLKIKELCSDSPIVKARDLQEEEEEVLHSGLPASDANSDAEVVTVVNDEELQPNHNGALEAKCAGESSLHPHSDGHAD